MKRAVLLLIIFSIFYTGNAAAQKLVAGRKAPDMAVSEWLTPQPGAGTAMLLDFFHSSSGESKNVLGKLSGFADRFTDRMNVVVISREEKAKVEGLLTGEDKRFLVALDDNGRTFANFAVEYVPFAVLVDAKGKVLWYGNPATLDNATIEDLLE